MAVISISEGELSRYRGKRVFVTGHTGFKGSWLSLWLSQLGAEVYGYALEPVGERSHFHELSLDRLIHHHQIADLRDHAAVARAVADCKPEVVFHLGAQALVRRSYLDPLETFTTNVIGGANLLDAVRHTDSVKALVFITSDKCYENKEWAWGYRETDVLGGKDPYSVSKAAAELVFASYRSSYFQGRPGFGCATTRAGNVIGGGDWSADRLIPDCIRSLEAGDPVIIRNPSSTRPWQFVLEPLSGYLRLGLRLLDAPERYSGAWNFGPSDACMLTVQEVAELVTRSWGEGIVSIRGETKPVHEAGLLKLAIDKASMELDWSPKYTAAEAIRETIRWYRARHGQASVPGLSHTQISEYMAARPGHD